MIDDLDSGPYPSDQERQLEALRAIHTRLKAIEEHTKWASYAIYAILGGLAIAGMRYL